MQFSPATLKLKFRAKFHNLGIANSWWDWLLEEQLFRFGVIGRILISKLKLLTFICAHVYMLTLI